MTIAPAVNMLGTALAQPPAMPWLIIQGAADELVPVADVEAWVAAHQPGPELVVMPETDCRMRWVVKLDKMGFAVSSGSACASGKEQTSHVMEAMGIRNSAASRVLRFSSGVETTLDAWRSLFEAVKEIHTASLNVTNGD